MAAQAQAQAQALAKEELKLELGLELVLRNGNGKDSERRAGASGAASSAEGAVGAEAEKKDKEAERKPPPPAQPAWHDFVGRALSEQLVSQERLRAGVAAAASMGAGRSEESSDGALEFGCGADRSVLRRPRGCELSALFAFAAADEQFAEQFAEHFRLLRGGRNAGFLAPSDEADADADAAVLPRTASVFAVPAPSGPTGPTGCHPPRSPARPLSASRRDRWLFFNEMSVEGQKHNSLMVTCPCM